MGTNNSGTDGRVRRTKQAIREAMVELLNRYPLDKISITMLCKEADVSRTAFYHHYDIPEDCFAEIMEELMAEMDSMSRREQRDNVGAMENFLSFVKANQSLFRVAYSLGFYHPVIQSSFTYNLNYIRSTSPNLDSVSETYVKFSNYGMFGLVSDWLAAGCPGNGEEIIVFYRKYMEELNLA